MDKKWMMETFPNYTEAMYMGNEPSYYSDYLTGKGPHYTSFYGTLDLTPSGEIWSSNITLGDKNNTIYMIGNKIELMHIPCDGIPHYWLWCNESMAKAKGLEGQGFFTHGKDCLPKYPKDYVEKLLKKKRPDRDGCFVWEKVKERFIEEFIKVEGDFI